MGKIAALTVAAATLVGAPLAAFAETIIDKTAHVAIDVPDGWKSETSGEVITLSDKKGDVAVTFVAVESGAVKAAGKAARKALESKITKLTFKEEKKITLDGMPGVAIDGDGFIGDTNIDLSVIVLDTPADKDLFIVAVAEDAKLAKHMDEIKYVFSHLHAKH